MRYSAFFLSTNDITIKLARPMRVNLNVKSDIFKIELFKKIPIEQITSIEVEHDVTDKTLSAGKALGGAIIAGPLGAVVGATMGGKKVSSTLTVHYTNDLNEACEAMFETKLASAIKEKLERSKQKAESTPLATPSLQQRTKSQSKSFGRGLFIYYTWPYQLYKKLKKKS